MLVPLPEDSEIPSAEVSAGERYFELASGHLQARRVVEAVAAYDKAVEQGFAADRCAAGRWECWMLLGRFERAWQESEFIARLESPDPHRFWDGRRFTGKRVIVRCLHGLGDAIQFIRYTPLLRREAVEVTIEAPPKLATLLGGAPAVDRVITWNDAPPPWDSQIEVMELPRAFGTTIRSVPAAVPYLGVDPLRLSRIRESLGACGSKRIGVVWAASSYNPERSVDLSEFDPLFRLAGMEFYSLQFEAETTQLLNPACSSDIADTAALILNLDLVITVDTMIAHLAGALGKPVWTLLPFRADWRWMLGRSDSPWYPTMRLFRQPAPGDWSSVVQAVARRLREFP